MGALNVVVADDHPVVTAGLQADLEPEFRIVARARTTAEAIAAIEQHQPDVVVCDVHMPGGGGIAVAAACGHLVPIVMFSVSEAEQDVLDAVAAGAAGYLPKTTATEDLRAALRHAAAGHPVFPPELAALLVGEFRRLARRASPTNPLSDREREVLILVAQGHTYRHIGERLYISPRTVERHVRRILDKLHLTRRDQLARYAADHNLT